MSTQTMELTANNIMQLIEQMPAPERQKLRALFDRYITSQPKTKPPRDKRVPSIHPAPDSTREWQWVEDHKHEYPGKWVALDGDRLIAACATEMEVWEAADNDGAYLPLVLRVPSPDDLPFVEDLVILK